MHTDYYKRPVFIFLIFYVILFIASSISHPSKPNPRLEPFADITVTGTSVQNPQTRAAKSNTIVKIKTINGAPAKGRLYVSYPHENTVNFMDAVRVKGKVRAPYSPDLKGNFNWAKYLENKNIYWELDGHEIEVTAPAPAPVRALNTLRQKILNLFKNSFDRDSAIILNGIVLGDKTQIPSELHKAFNDSGAMHLLVASGANVGFVTVMIYYLCVLFGVKYNLRLPLALIAAGVYTVLAGADAPLVRAYLMAICTGIGLKTGRNSGAFHGLTLAALIILLINPKSIFDVGFQMSFLATFIILLSVNTFRVPRTWPKILRVCLEIFLITTAVQLVLLPIYTNVFYRFSFTALISNIFLVPLSGILMGLGFILFLLNALSIGFLFKAFLFVTHLLLIVFKFLVDFFSSFSFSAITMPALSAPSAALFYVALFFIYNLNMFKHNKKIIFAALCALALFAVLINPFKPKNFIYLLNTQDTNAAVINISGKTFVVNAGMEEKYLLNTILSGGVRKADIEFAQTNTLAKMEVMPFADIWPGEEIDYKGIKIKALWGINGREGNTWQNTGYSGTAKDCLSYNFKFKDIDFTTSCKSNFLLEGETFTYNRKNATVKIKL